MHNQTSLYPLIIKDYEHTMGTALYDYLKMKMHHLLDTTTYSHVHVIGSHSRGCSVISEREKIGKITNWQRPTALMNKDQLNILCYPGRDYVRHYATMIRSYLEFENKSHINVTYELPSEHDCLLPILNSGLDKLPIQKTVIIGFAIDKMFPDVDLKETYDFYIGSKVISGNPVTFLIYKHSFWGDILGRIGMQLVELGAERIYFTGKVGGLKSFLKPNASLATGNKTYIEGEMIEWDNAISTEDTNDVYHGVHISSPSVMFETKHWLKNVSSQFEFVDPEVGQIARSLHSKGISFGYIHIVSNTLLEEASENLSNERDVVVLKKRNELIIKMKNILVESIIK